MDEIVVYGSMAHLRHRREGFVMQIGRLLVIASLLLVSLAANQGQNSTASSDFATQEIASTITTIAAAAGGNIAPPKKQNAPIGGPGISAQTGGSPAAVIDFEGLNEGDIVSSVSCDSGIVCDFLVPGSVSVLGINSRFPDANAAMIFDATCKGACSGEDKDLKKPSLGNVLIISEDLDDSDPDDEKRGGTFEFDFSKWRPGTVRVVNLDVLDIDEKEKGGHIDLLSGGANGTLLETVPIPITGNNGLVTVTIEVSGADFMRLTVVGSGAIDNIRADVPAMQAIEGSLLDNLTNDSDSDGIFDERESALGIDPNNPDSDEDGFSDFFEDNFGEFGFDPLRATLDTDGDGLSDTLELSLDISPDKLDTDKDGWGDFDEVLNEFFGFDPLIPTLDNDFDGLADSLESSLETSSSSTDSDDDGIGDFQGFSVGSDSPTPDPSDRLGELIGSTISPAMEQALENMQEGEDASFPPSLAEELPYSEVTQPPIIAEIVVPSAALMQRAVFNPTASEPLYDSYNNILRQLQEIAQQFDGTPNPRIVRLFRWSEPTVDCCIQPVEFTFINKPGRFLYALKISDNPQNNEEEPEFFFMGMHHARELITTSIAMGLIKELTDKYAAGDETIQSIVCCSEIWVIPIMNPNGYHMALGELSGELHGGPKVDWRKNTRLVDELTPEGNRQSTALRGVDLNRNYGFEHLRTLTTDQRAGLSKRAKDANGLRADGNFNLDDDGYAGPMPFSEVETQAVKGLAENLFATGSEVSGLGCSLSWHSYLGLVLHPLGHTPFPPNTGLSAADRDRFNNMAQAVAAATNYRNLRDTFQFQRRSFGYPVFGSSDDWLFKERRVFALTVEAYSQGAGGERMGTGPAYFPETEAKRDAVVQNNVKGALALVNACTPFIIDLPPPPP
jgi:hypothetical protein